MTAVEHAAKALFAWWEEAGVEPTEPLEIPATIAPPPETQAPKPAKRTPIQAPSKADEALAAAHKAAAEAADLKELFQAIRAFDQCALKKASKTTVLPEGALDAPVLVLGHAPGADDDAAGKPFAGPEGVLLDQMLAAIGLGRQTNALLSHCVFWRPPGNRPPEKDEFALCRPFVDRLIALQQPRLILLAGGSAAQAMLQTTETVMRLRGQRLHCTTPGLTTPVNAIVMLHPAYLLSQPAQKRLAWADLLAMETWLQELGVPLGPHL
jgi:DNA polymerase